MINSVISYFIKGGPCMWPLLLCSILVVSICIQKLIYLYKTVSSHNFVWSFYEIITKLPDKIDEAKELAVNNKGFAAKLAYDMLNEDNITNSYKEKIKEQVDYYFRKWDKYIIYLDTITSIAPMLGLLGTITGMITSFNGLNDKFSNPSMITSGIGEALITTVFGLCISIIGVMISVYLEDKIREALQDLRLVADALTRYYDNKEV